MVFIVMEATKTGVLTTGLVAKITIYNLSHATPSTVVVTAETMTEVGHGLYIYKFAADSNKKYACYIDKDSDGAGGLAASERYENALIDPSLGYMVAV